MKKGLISTLTTIAVLYIGICIYFYFIQNAILFKPTQLDSGYLFRYTFNFEERWFEIGEEARVHAIHAKADSSKGLVVFFHGNGGSANTSPAKFELFLNNGYDVLYPDYRGYGLTEGTMWNEDDLVGDMKVVYREIAKEYNDEDIVIVGYSLGSGVAAQIAAEFDSKALILWTPYYSMVDMKDSQYWFLPDFLVRYPLRTDLALQQVDEPITIFYAAEDELLPVDRAIHLNDFLDGNDEFIMLTGQGHNRVFNNEQLKAKMAEILAED